MGNEKGRGMPRPFLWLEAVTGANAASARSKREAAPFFGLHFPRLPLIIFPMSVFMHIDMDAFFAAVEASDHPAWRGKPVIVGADPREGKGRGVVSTASYEARRFGVHSAMPISRAFRLCPDGIYVRPRMGRYQEVSDRIMAIFERFTPRIQPISLDEAFLDASGCERLFGAPERMALRIKEAVISETRLTCSVGLSRVKSVAKIASDFRKPDGLTVVPPGTERDFLAPLPVRKLWGVGPKAAAVLEREGIRTAGDIQTASVERMKALFGRAAGEHYWNMANAVDPREVTDDEESKSISHETTFHADVQDEDTLNRTLLWLADKVASRMRRHGLRCRTVTLKYRTESFRTFTRRRSLADPVADTASLYEAARSLMATLKGTSAKVRLLGIAASGLEADKGVQGVLFQGGRQVKNRASEAAVDRVRRRFGSGSILRGSLLRPGEDPPSGGSARKQGREEHDHA